MSSFMVSIIFAIGAGAWVYNKVQQRNGGLYQQSLLAAGVCAVMAFIFFFSIASRIL